MTSLIFSRPLILMVQMAMIL